MNYIYNIYLNYNKEYYDFYDWLEKDKIIFIKKIPLIKTSIKTFKDIISNNIKLDINIFKEIENKTETKCKECKSCVIITDSRNICSIQFDNNGISNKISSLPLENEIEIIKTSKLLKERNINYTIINKRNYFIETRIEKEKQLYVLKKLKNISFDTLKYLYYDCFNKEEKNYKKMYNHIIKKINNNDKYIYEKIYNALNPLSTNIM